MRSRGVRRVHLPWLCGLLLLALWPWPRRSGGFAAAEDPRPLGPSKEPLPYVEVPIARSMLDHREWERFLS